jgi:hypothetical protein
MMRTSIEIAGILLPALVIILSVSRIFLRKTKGVNGMIIFCAVLLLFIGLLQYFVFKDSSNREPDTKLPPLPVSEHSEVFNRSIEKVLGSYLEMSAAFAAKDTSAIRIRAMLLAGALDSLPVEELKADSLIYETALQPLGNTKAETRSILHDPQYLEKLASFNVLSNEMYTLLRTVRYDLARLYWMECPAAFGEDRPGNWISRSAAEHNPYGIEDCAETRSTLDFLKPGTP